VKYAPVDESVLDEQLDYYRARAPEYDQWFQREGRYDRGPEANDAWRRELADVRRTIDELRVDGRRVLELASGTGLWTSEFVERGALVTAVDGAPEMVEQLRARIGDGVDVQLADLFTWTPTSEFDVVASCFFMSHVPDERMDDFARVVSSACRVGGSVFLLDGLREPTSTAADHVLPAEGDQTMLRRLDDGREFRIVKRFREDEEIAAVFAPHGVRLEARGTPTYFQVAVGTKS
jgi:SAM-dependent methyltransferase